MWAVWESSLKEPAAGEVCHFGIFFPLSPFLPGTKVMASVVAATLGPQRTGQVNSRDLSPEILKPLNQQQQMPSLHFCYVRKNKPFHG